jgi:hypothetical protein
MKQHPFNRLPNYRYGFEIGEELRWFDFISKYYNRLKEETRRLNAVKHEDINKMDWYLAIKEEKGLFEYLLFNITANELLRKFHADFLKSKELDGQTKVKLKNKYVKTYEESEFKDGKYYLSIIKA